MKKEENASDRRKFLKTTGGALIAVGAAGYFEASAQHHKKVSFSAANDPLGSATVSFGGWMTNPTLDRFTAPPPPTANHHELIPYVAKIKAGGYVNFIISGLHVVAVYDDGTKPEDIDRTLLVPILPPAPPRFGPRIMNDPNNRIYRGIDPVIANGPPPVLNLDRVEVVHFGTPGTYLVICAVLPHFDEGMYGYVRVLANNGNTAGE